MRHGNVGVGQRLGLGPGRLRITWGLDTRKHVATCRAAMMTTRWLAIDSQTLCEMLAFVEARVQGHHRPQRRARVGERTRRVSEVVRIVNHNRQGRGGSPDEGMLSERDVGWHGWVWLVLGQR